MLCTRPIWSMFLVDSVEFLFANNVIRVHRMREELCDDTLAYDLEF